MLNLATAFSPKWMKVGPISKNQTNGLKLGMEKVVIPRRLCIIHMENLLCISCISWKKKSARNDFRDIY